MNETTLLLPDAAPSKDADVLRAREAAARAQVASLFRKRGDSTLMRTLEQAVLDYRLEQQP
jgi:hypothetical protein